MEAEWRIYASVNWDIIGEDNGLSPGQRQAIIWTIDWNIVNWTLWNKLNWTFNMATIFFGPSVLSGTASVGVLIIIDSSLANYLHITKLHHSEFWRCSNVWIPQTSYKARPCNTRLGSVTAHGYFIEAETK